MRDARVVDCPECGERHRDDLGCVVLDQGPAVVVVYIVAGIVILGGLAALLVIVAWAVHGG